MKSSVLFAVLMLAVTAGAAVSRLRVLDNRPMHCDEAGQAVNFGRLLEQGRYVYNPSEYHGPTLAYFTLPVAWAASAGTLVEITETHLRLLPAIFGIALVALAWPLRRLLGCPAALCIAMLTAVSPAMVFYSRYYIQEMLLVGFTLGAIVALCRLARTVDDGEAVASRLWPGFWLIVLGACVGMMHASKETCVIPLFAMTVAAAIAFGNPGRLGPKRLAPKRLVLAGLVVLVTAASVSSLLFSSFFDNPRGVVDSYATFAHYLKRAGGEGSAGRHDHAWNYYLRILFWWQRDGGPIWSEAAIAVMAVVGFIGAAFGGCIRPTALPTVRFLAVYTLLMTVIYSAVPYKTPWCALGFLHGMILLAGVGMTIAVRAAPGAILKTTVIVLLTLATGHLAWQAHRASFTAHGDPNNPYVYSHTTRDVPRLAKRLGEIADVHENARAMHVQVICPDDDYWPLPWYLRDFSRVGWFRQMPQGPMAPLIVTQPAMEQDLSKRLYVDPPPGQRPLYMPLGPEEEGREWELRPRVPLRVYIRSDLWEAQMRR